MSEHAIEKGAGRTLYAVILAALIEWAGEAADLDYIRSVARHLTPVVRAYRMPDRSRIAVALKGHRLDTMSQDSGQHCVCGSDSRFEQANGDHPWTSIYEHRADMVMRVFSPGEGRA
jgi:hypothetical protein